MYESDAPSSKRALAALETPGTPQRLVRAARKIAGSWADGDDLQADALIRVLDPDDSPWVKWTFLTHMTFVMKHHWDQLHRAVRFDREIADEDVTRGKKGVSREPRADDELDRRRSLAVLQDLGAQLLAEVAHKHPLVPQCFELGIEGIEEPAEQADALNAPIAEVYEAHRILKRHARRVRTQWELAEEQRMRSLREGFSRTGRPGGESDS